MSLSSAPCVPRANLRCTACCRIARLVATLHGLLQRCTACCKRCTACCKRVRIRHCERVFDAVDPPVHLFRVALGQRKHAGAVPHSVTHTLARAQASQPSCVRVRKRHLCERPVHPDLERQVALQLQPRRAAAVYGARDAACAAAAALMFGPSILGSSGLGSKCDCARPKRDGPGLSGKGLGRSGRSAACLCVERAVDARHVCEHLPQRPEAALRPARLSVPLFRIIRTRIPDYPYP